MLPLKLLFGQVRSMPRFDVIMLATVHAAMDDRVFHREAKTLREAGLTVCVVAPHSNSEYRDGVWIEALPRQANRIRRLLLQWTLLRRVLQLRGRIFIFHDPELFGVALVLRLLGRRVIYD